MYSRKIYTKLTLESIFLKKPIYINEIPRSLIEFAKRNKMLYLLGLYDERIRLTENWNELDCRRKEQAKAITEVAEIAEKLSIPLLIVKTFKPFVYVPDDIDILILEERSVRSLVYALFERGYLIRKRGTPEITLRKVNKNTFVDLDIHTKLASGPYEYIDKYYLWRRRRHVRIRDVLVFTPNEVDELLITAAHAVMKELSITMADVLHILSINKTRLIAASDQSKMIGLSTALIYILNLARRVIQALSKQHMHNIVFPAKVPLFIVAQAYRENLMYRYKAHAIRPLREMLSMPSSKGIGILLRYIVRHNE